MTAIEYVGEADHVTIGRYREDGDFDVFATLNNGDGFLMKADFKLMTDRIVEICRILGNYQDVVALNRQDAPDTVTVEEDYLIDDYESLGIPMPIDFNKYEYILENGYPYRNLCANAKSENYPIIGLVELPSGTEKIIYHSRYGKNPNRGKIKGFNLVRKMPKVKQ